MSVDPDQDSLSVRSPGHHADGQGNSVTASVRELSWWSGYPATLALIGLNLLIFGAMCPAGPLPRLVAGWLPSGNALRGLTEKEILERIGALFTAPFPEPVLLRFGACATDRVVAGRQWWRLVTANFVHVHLLHLLTNLWCLWNLGFFGERLLGGPGLLAVYVLTGVAGMLQSLVISLLTGQDLLVAGASAAVFGIAGLLIVLLSNRKLALPWKELRTLRLQVIFFAGVNLLLGMAPQLLGWFFAGHAGGVSSQMAALPRVDNSAHLGGLLCGLALGVPLFPRLASGRSSYRARQIVVFTAAGLCLLLLGYAVATFAGHTGL